MAGVEMAVAFMAVIITLTSNKSVIGEATGATFQLAVTQVLKTAMAMVQ